MFLPQRKALLVQPVSALRTELNVEVQQNFRQEDAHLVVRKAEWLRSALHMKDENVQLTSCQCSSAAQAKMAAGPPSCHLHSLFRATSAPE